MANVKIYSNTGFSTVDIPENLTLVKTECDLFDEFDDGNIIQAQGLNNVIVRGITSQDAATIDFVIVRDNDGLEVGYNVLDNYQMVSPNTCKFGIVEAALSTIFDDIVILSANANRMCVDDDDTTYYTNLEPFQPAEAPIILHNTMDTRFPTTANTDILETITIPPKFQKITSADKKVQSVPSGMSGDVNSNEYKIGITYPIYGSEDPGLMARQYMTSHQKITTVGKDTVEQIQIQSIDDPVFRKLIPTQYTITPLITDTPVTISLGSKWWLKEDIEATDITGYADYVGRVSVINDLRSLGADNNITNYWSVPTVYTSAIVHSAYQATQDDAYGGVTSIGNSKVKAPYQFATTASGVKNNKARYAQCQTITVYSPVSGQSITKQPYEVANPSNTPASDHTVADYEISADIRPDGCPIFAWKYTNGSPQANGVAESIQGGNWRKIPVAADVASGAYFQARENRLSREQTGIQTGVGVVGGVVSTAVGIATGNPIAAIGGGLALLNTAGSFIAQSRAQQEQQSLLNAQGTIATAELKISTSNFLRDSGNNTFYCYFTYWKEEDIHNFDTFLTMYGYNVGNKSITKADFTSRPHFNYVRLNSISMKTSEYSMYLRNIATEELKLGVRIWHEVPNRGAITSGNK